MNESNLDVAVGMSRKWDAREAGRDVARDTIKNLKTPPKFFVLFTTIHYEKYGGFQELLNGVYDVLPYNTPLVGGTVTGFSNNKGVFARGCTALAASTPHMDVAIGYGRNTKRSPKKAARESAKKIKNDLESSCYKNKFLLNLISASEIPNIPFVGRKKIYSEKISTKLLLRLFSVSQYLFQKGVGRDDEVIEELTNQLPDYKMLGGGTLDSGENLRNFQFFNDKVMRNSIVSLGIKTNINLDVLTTHNMKKTDVNFKITKTNRNGRIIHKINNKPAASEFIRLLGLPDNYLNEKNWYKTTYYFPLGSKVSKKDDFEPRVIGGIFGDSLVTVIRSKEKDGTILTINGKRLLETIDQNLNSLSTKEPKFGLISSCSTRMITLEDQVYQARDRILEYFKDKPFIVFYVGGESTYSPERGLKYVNMSFNSAVFW